MRQTCPHCGEDYDNWNSHWLLDVLIAIDRVSVQVSPCCVEMRDLIATVGYQAATGRDMDDVLREIGVSPPGLTRLPSQAEAAASC